MCVKCAMKKTINDIKNTSRITKFTRGPSVFHTTMRNKQP